MAGKDQALTALTSDELVARIRAEGPRALCDYLLLLCAAAGSGKVVAPSAVAQAFRPVRADEVKGAEAWRQYLRQVRVEAIGLARQGHIDILRKGEPIDPTKAFKGVYGLRWRGAGTGGQVSESR